MKHLITAMLTIFLLAGCAYRSTGVYERPNGEAFNASSQHRLASASHWKLVAENESKLLGRKIARKPSFIEKNPTSNFSRTYHNLLTSSLVQNGANILTENRPETAKISYEVQVVPNYGGKQASGLHGDFPLPIAGAAYYIVSEAMGLTKVLPAVVGEQMMKDLSSATEVVITTRATQNAGFLYSASNVYYIEGANQWDYLTPLPPPPKVSPSESMWNYQLSVVR